MVSTASTLWYVDAGDPAAVLREHRDPDPAAAKALAEQLFGDYEIVPKMIGTLAGCAGPDPDEVYIGCFPGLTVVCTRAARLPDPAALPELLIRPLASEHTYLVSFDTGMGWGSFAHWERGEFRRGFSSSRMKILADAGLPLVWERPFWAGERPALWRADEIPDPQCLPYDPPDFADEANHQWLGFQYRAPVVAGALLPRDVAVCGFTLVPKSPPLESPAPEPDPREADGRVIGPGEKSDAHGRARGRRRGPRALEAGHAVQAGASQAQVVEPHEPAPRSQAPAVGPERPAPEPQSVAVTPARQPADTDEGAEEDRELGPRGHVLGQLARTRASEQAIGARGQVPAAQRQLRGPLDAISEARTSTAVEQAAAEQAVVEQAVVGQAENGSEPRIGAPQRAFGQRGPTVAQQAETARPLAQEAAPVAPPAAPHEKERRGLLGWFRDATRTT